jgi:hypothetical protein
MNKTDEKAIVPALHDDSVVHEVEIDNKFDEEKGGPDSTIYTKAVDIDSPEHLREVECE